VFPLTSRNFVDIYRSQTHALHLHDYEGQMMLAGRRIELQPGSFTLTPSGIPSSYHLPRTGTHWCIHFLPEPLKRGSCEPIVRLPIVTQSGRHRDDAAGRFANVSRLLTLSTQSPGDECLSEAVSVALQELLLWVGLLDRVHPPAAEASLGHALDKLVAYVDRNLHRKLSAAAIADLVGLSQNYLARVFRQRAGQTIPGYVIARRVALARLLLRTTDLSVKQIGLRVGYPDPQHFNKLFRSVTGVSPTDFRARG